MFIQVYMQLKEVCNGYLPELIFSQIYWLYNSIWHISAVAIEVYVKALD